MQPYAGGSPWESSLRDSVSNRAFSNFKVSVAIVSLSLSLTPTPTPTPSHSQTRALSLSHKPTHSHRISLTHATVARPHTLSASLTTPSLILSLFQPHTHTLSLSHKPKHSHRVSLTHATVARPPTLSASPMLPSLVLHIVFKISEFWLVIIELWSPSVCTVSENQKKKVSPFMQNAKCKVCFTVCMLRNSGKNGRIFCESFFFCFFFFWFLFWISNRTVKKDWSFIVFWVQIMFLGLFIFWVCLGFRVLSFGFRWLFRC